MILLLINDPGHSGQIMNLLLLNWIINIEYSKNNHIFLTTHYLQSGLQFGEKIVLDIELAFMICWLL